MTRSFTFAVLAAIAAMTAGAASAQQNWTHGGITFPERAGWCIDRKTEETALGDVEAFTAHPCDQEFPMFSAGLVAPGMEAVDLAVLTADARGQLDTQDGKVMVDDLMEKRDPECARQSYRVDANPAPPLLAFAVIATYDCPSFNADVVNFHNLTAYAQTKAGDIWVVAFDYPLSTITDADRDMLIGAVTAINAK